MDISTFLRQQKDKERTIFYVKFLKLSEELHESISILTKKDLKEAFCSVGDTDEKLKTSLITSFSALHPNLSKDEIEEKVNYLMEAPDDLPSSSFQGAGYTLGGSSSSYESNQHPGRSLTSRSRLLTQFQHRNDSFRRTS